MEGSYEYKLSCLELNGIIEKGKVYCYHIDDALHPLFPNYNHWVIWIIPVQNVIPEAIRNEEVVKSLGGAIQGIAYGRNKYKGPKPPFKWIHNYVFTIYILDCKLDLSPKSKKKDLLDGHILQKATLSG